jgi:hypothetical protein
VFVNAAVVTSLVVLFLPAAASAQSTIAGLVKDASGAILPGVTVEASSPALIEKVRVAVTDGQGRYTIIDLRPGVYKVTFTVTGFTTFVQDQIDLPSDFTATVNADMKLGAVEESVTVSGQSPVVDVQNAQRTTVLNRELLDAIPVARMYQAEGALAVGTKVSDQNVGGARAAVNPRLTAHMSVTKDTTIDVDGMKMNTLVGGGDSHPDHNDAMSQEITVQTAALGAEVSAGGPHLNLIPREGGNRFSGSAFGNFSKRSLSRSNWTADLQARGLKAPPGFDSLVDESGAFGGPIRRDRLWFFVAHRYRSNDLTGSNQFYSIDPLAYVYNPDFTRPLNAGGWDMDNQARVTAQVSARNKVSGFYDKINKCNCPTIIDSPFSTGESGTRLMYPLSYLASLSWQSTITSKLLFDGAISYNTQPTDNGPQPEAGITMSIASALELSTNRRLRAPFAFGGGDQAQRQARASLSYVTGSHSAKVGMTWHHAWSTGGTYPFSSDMGLQLLNGIPSSVVLRTDPYTTRTNVNADLGIYAQDRWTVRRVTLFGGVRFDYFNIGIPAQSAPASTAVA